MDEKFGDFIIRTATNLDQEQIRNVVFDVLAEYRLSPDPLQTDADLDDIERNYLESGGTFEVVLNEQSQIVGTVGLFPVSPEVCELRKMYLTKCVRGMGLGRHLMERMVKQARQLGFQTITLETASVLKEAIQLYTRFGFQSVSTSHLSSRCDQAYALHL